jgi:hypothetical protein
MTVPGIGAKVADNILELREAKGDLELDDLNQVPYLRTWPCPVPSHFPINLSTLLTLSLCRSYRDPIPSFFSKEVKSKQSSNGCVILRYGT